MFIPPYDLPSDTHTKSDFLTPTANNKGMPRDKMQSTGLHEPTYRVFLDDPLTSEDNLNRKDQPFLVNNFTLFLVTEANRQYGQDMPKIHPNVVRMPHPASNDDNRCA